jgi:hypothetical protein
MFPQIYGILSAIGVKIVYLLRDEFLTDEAAPLASPRTAEPGPGTLIINDSDNAVSISGGRAQITQPNNWTNSLRSEVQFARQTGLAAFATLNGNQRFGLVGWHDNATPNQVGISGIAIVGFDNVNLLAGVNKLSIIVLPSGYTFDTDMPASTVLRTAGSWLLAKVAGLWTLLWVANAGTASNLYAALTGNVQQATPLKFDNFHVVALPAPWDDDWGIATNRIATTSDGSTTTSEANAIIEHTITAATGVTQELDVRRTDADNRWIIRMDQAGSTIKLIERNGGFETERSSAAQTWTNGTAYRVVVIQDGNAIRTFVANVAKNTYTSATFNNTATDVRVSHAGADLVAWPRTLSGAALAALEAV